MSAVSVVSFFAEFVSTREPRSENIGALKRGATGANYGSATSSMTCRTQNELDRLGNTTSETQTEPMNKAVVDTGLHPRSIAVPGESLCVYTVPVSSAP